METINMKEEEVKKQQDAFILNEIMNFSISGAMTRGEKRYENNNELSDKKYEDKKEELRKTIKEFLLHEIYEKIITISEITENTVINWIDCLKKEITENFSGILQDEEFRIGISQKIINLFLKYLWVLQKCPMPPHCPFDSIILEKLNNRLPCWTKMNSIEIYKEYVKAVKEYDKKGLSIAEWELEYWNKN